MTQHAPSTAALGGIRILDLTSVIFGPYASLILADYGADVIKVESPAGDSTRYTGPSLEHDSSAIFLGANRNKRSLVLDLKQASAREALLRLVDQADVFMHSMRPQKMVKLGLDHATLLSRNPKLVYAGLYGFSEDGAYAGMPAYDDTIQGLSGIADMMARQSGTPRYLPTIAADKTCGMTAAHAILAALFQRERTGKGQFVEIPMFESMVSYNLVEHFYGRHLVGKNETPGYPRTLSPYRKPYKTSDGYVCLMPYTDAHWQRFFTAGGRPELASDPRFANITARTRNIDALYAAVDAMVESNSTTFWLDLCNHQEIPATRVNTLSDLETDPHLQSVGFFVDLESATGDKYRFTRSPVKLQNSAVDPHLPPRLGEHTCEVLREAGLDTRQIETLLEQGAARAAEPGKP